MRLARWKRARRGLARWKRARRIEMEMNTMRNRTIRGFTLVELLVSVTVSVVLLAILAMVFQLSTRATRNANTRIALTERMRALNIRLRQEVGNMLNIARTDDKDGKTYIISPGFDSITFSTATDEDGRQVNVDVKYEYAKGTKPEDGKLIRRRDLTGPYLLDNTGEVKLNDKTKAPEINGTYIVGDGKFFEDGKAGNSSAPSTVMLANVREVIFRIIDPPPGPNDPILTTQLNPRTLPAAIEMQIKFGPEPGSGDVESLESLRLVFPVYRGL